MKAIAIITVLLLAGCAGRPPVHGNAKGDEEIMYDGETHTAANLFDALKEGYYGKL